MIISCPECRGRFRIDPSALGTDGRTVRCGKCAHTWLQTPPPPESAPIGDETTGFAPAPAPTVSVEAVQVGGASDADSGTAEFDEAEDWHAPAARDDEDVPVRSRRRSRAPAAAISTRKWPAVVAWMCLILVVAGFGAGLYVFRDNVMNTWPDTASLYDQLDLAQPGFGLVLAAPEARQTNIGGKFALVIEGRIENPTKRERMVPKTLRLQLLDKDQQELQVETFESPARRLLPEQSIPYKFELKDPAEKRDVLLISFAEEKK